MTNMKVNLVAICCNWLNLALPGSRVSVAMSPRRGSNPTRARTPLRWCEKIPSWLSHAMSCWDSGFVGSGLWPGDGEENLASKSLLLQGVEHIIEYNISWDRMDITMRSTNTHIRTLTRGNILKSLPTGLLTLLGRTQPTSLMGPNSASGYMFHWVQYRKIASLTTNQFPNTAKFSSSVFFGKNSLNNNYPDVSLIKHLFWNMSHRTHQWLKILWELAINHHP